MPSLGLIDPDCKFSPGYMAPIIDPTRCKAEAACVPICPYSVLAESSNQR